MNRVARRIYPNGRGGFRLRRVPANRVSPRLLCHALTADCATPHHPVCRRRTCSTTSAGTRALPARQSLLLRAAPTPPLQAPTKGLTTTMMTPSPSQPPSVSRPSRPSRASPPSGLSTLAIQLRPSPSPSPSPSPRPSPPARLSLRRPQSRLCPAAPRPSRLHRPRGSRDARCALNVPPARACTASHCLSLPSSAVQRQIVDLETAKLTIAEAALKDTRAAKAALEVSSLTPPQLPPMPCTLYTPAFCKPISFV